ncbi:hypothetical protein Pcac1_g78 [Phytophthora cactorum]|uniref:HSF-type DNA-binding domain-containing protein n=3 Tax=Phytophthora cactorum TaxID=29920 RepID=A0A329SP05_9STRA|nr:hypothetical protein Pcac1_g78 [Phytophthora cactorum]RAW38335.1 hypothetical protein PC110_g5423 [Phytophthora cactorum]
MNLYISNTIDAAFATVPRFVRAVYDMLQNEDQRILSWSADGSRFQVYDVPRLETEVLRKYFKHDKFSSFQRQLNNFGFHKWTKTRASVATFSHDMLVRCHPSQLSALVSQMKLKQKAVTTTTATPVEPSTSMKRPRSLLETSTTQHTALVKKPKMSPRDVCAVHELSGMSFASILEPLWLLEDDICSSEDDLLLLDALDSVELTALDWDAVVSSVDDSNGDSDSSGDSDSDSSVNDVNAVLDFFFELDCAPSIGVLDEAHVSAILSSLETSQTLSDCELDVLLEDLSDIKADDVDALLFV